jgi:uncharacterized protein (TIGR02147 family)
LEYRDFLRDYYEERKNRHNWFSYRYIASKTGVDASFLVKVIQKQMHLADRSISEMREFLGLQDKEGEYFETLVHFNKAKRPTEIKQYFEKIISLRTPYTSPLDANKYEFFHKWYNIAIYELLSFFPYRENEAHILAQALNPPISVAECRRAIGLLESLQMIRKEPDGTYKHVEAVVSTGEHWRSIAIHNFQKEVLQLGLDALNTVAIDLRDISTLTMSLSPTSVRFLKERLKEIRKEFIEIARNDVGPTEVFQFNLELFPVTRITTKGVSESKERKGRS